jgi:hypothetical protein
MLAVDVHLIPARTVATAWTTRHQKLNFGSFAFPVTAQLGPSLALQREGAAGIQSHYEGAKLQRG